MKAGRVLAVLAVGAVLLIPLGCGGKHPSGIAPLNQAQVKISFLKSSLIQQVDRVILDVVSDDAVIYTDTAVVQDGAFAFPTFELPPGEALFLLSAVDVSGLTIYSRSTTVTIVGGGENRISVELLPAVPMAKLSPYYSTVESGDEFTSTLEFFNISKFFNGSFKIAYDPQRIEFRNAVEQADTAWGPLITFARNLGDTVVLSISRTQGRPDGIPDTTYALVRLRFRAIADETTELKLVVDRLEDFDGPIDELSNLFVDHQTIQITPTGGR